VVQKRAPASAAAPQPGQVRLPSEAPQEEQKLPPAGAAQRGQVFWVMVDLF